MISAFPNSKAEMEKAQAFFREALETAVRKMTAAPAARLDLSNRGTIAPGKRADLLIFDNNAFRDEATYLEPMKTASGLSLAFVNGVKAVEGAAPICTNAGQVL